MPRVWPTLPPWPGAPLRRAVALAFAVCLAAPAPARAARGRPPPVVGRWNLTVTGADGATFPSWLEITFGDDGKLGGRLCGRFGVAEPLARVEWKKNQLIFVDREKTDDGNDVERLYKAKIAFGMLDGEASAPRGPPWSFIGARPPKFRERGRVPWGKSVTLISKGLLGWRLRTSAKGACWKQAAGVLSNRSPCVDIASDGRYQDFKLRLEFKLAKGASSGVWLRGRYEVPLRDDAGERPSDRGTGAVHGLTAPLRNAAGSPEEWQTLDVTLIGRRITAVVNGVRVLDNHEIAGPTGGALDSEEAIPGPIMLRGDEGEVSFRNIVLSPALW
jgi:Domain of Unknown Function (DUF1080)